MRVTAVRRAQVEPFDPEAPASGYGLTERGRVQARLLGARLARDGRPDAVYTGDSDRHRATADLVAGSVAAITGSRPSITVEAGLDDIAWTLEALRTCHEERLTQREWRQRWTDGALAIDESVPDARERLRAVADRLADRHGSTEHLLLVTSTVPVLLLAGEAMGTAIEETRLSIVNAAVTRLEWDEGAREAAAINDTAHLPGALETRDGFLDRT